MLPKKINPPPGPAEGPLHSLWCCPRGGDNRKKKENEWYMLAIKPYRFLEKHPHQTAQI